MIVCPNCKGMKHIKDGTSWKKCDCVLSEAFCQSREKLGISEEVAASIKTNGAKHFTKNIAIFERCEERLKLGELPKKPLLFFGSLDYLKSVELFFRLYKPNLCSNSMFDVVDAFFNDTNRFRGYFCESINIFYLGSEVQNEAVAKVLSAIFLARSRPLVILMSCSSSFKSFLSIYPPSVEGVLKQFNVKEVM